MESLPIPAGIDRDVAWELEAYFPEAISGPELVRRGYGFPRFAGWKSDSVDAFIIDECRALLPDPTDK